MNESNKTLSVVAICIALAVLIATFVSCGSQSKKLSELPTAEQMSNAVSSALTNNKHLQEVSNFLGEDGNFNDKITALSQSVFSSLIAQNLTDGGQIKNAITSETLAIIENDPAYKELKSFLDTDTSTTLQGLIIRLVEDTIVSSLGFENISDFVSAFQDQQLLAKKMFWGKTGLISFDENEPVIFAEGDSIEINIEDLGEALIVDVMFVGNKKNVVQQLYYGIPEITSETTTTTTTPTESTSTETATTPTVTTGGHQAEEPEETTTTESVTTTAEETTTTTVTTTTEQIIQLKELGSVGVENSIFRITLSEEIQSDTVVIFEKEDCGDGTSKNVVLFTINFVSNDYETTTTEVTTTTTEATTTTASETTTDTTSTTTTMTTIPTKSDVIAQYQPDGAAIKKGDVIEVQKLTDGKYSFKGSFTDKTLKVTFAPTGYNGEKPELKLTDGVFSIPLNLSVNNTYVFYNGEEILFSVKYVGGM